MKENNTKNKTIAGITLDRGFTLLEFMIVCSLLAVLVTWAIPTWHSYVQRGHRTTAIELLIATASCQERVYSVQSSYDTRYCQFEHRTGAYKLRMEPEDEAESESYLVIATPVDQQTADPCGSLTLNQSGIRNISGPQERQRKCWESR
jgi:type IV pilus assembly protein PilE